MREATFWGEESVFPVSEGFAPFFKRGTHLYMSLFPSVCRSLYLRNHTSYDYGTPYGTSYDYDIFSYYFDLVL